MHKSHFAGCAVGILLAIGFIVVTGGSSSGYGLLLVALACPVGMILAMKFMMNDHQHTAPHDHGTHEPADAGTKAT